MAEDDKGDAGGGKPIVCLLPYDRWHNEAQRHLAVAALKYVSKNGLPGEHHFYLGFRTDHPGTVIPARLRARYPQEMTIVLQHQFWDLEIDEAAGLLSVGLSFGGVGSTLTIPLAAITSFADPYVHLALRIQPDMPEHAEVAEPEADSAPAPEAGDKAEPASGDEAATGAEPPAAPSQVISLDAFRHRTPPKQ